LPRICSRGTNLALYSSARGVFLRGSLFKKSIAANATRDVRKPGTDRQDLTRLVPPTRIDDGKAAAVDKLGPV